MPRIARPKNLERDAAALQRVLTDLIRVYQFRDRDAVCCYDVSTGQCHGLERLAKRGPMSLNEFAASLYLEKSSASRLANGTWSCTTIIIREASISLRPLNINPYISVEPISDAKKMFFMSAQGGLKNQINIAALNAKRMPSKNIGGK